jgi:signal transduction histidine kinase
VGPDLELVMVYRTQEISDEKSRATRPFVIMAVTGLALVAGLAYLTAQTIARPLERLAGQARALPAGEVLPVGGGPELDHLVEAMNRMLAEVRRSERLAVMGQMAAGVAHEIRNPLSSMKMTVQMLREGAAKPEPYDLLLREIERLELTAAELVGVSQPLRKEPVRLDAVVDDVLELMRRRLDHLAVRVERRYAPTPEVRVDVARFKRCVMNLVLNGAQAMPSGGPLRVDLAPRDGRVRLAVTDGGPGVPPEVRDRIFEPFVTTKQDGVGLGLALTKRIVEDHGGAIGFEPAERGTTFWVELPNG